LPDHVAWLRAADQQDLAGGGVGQRRSLLKDEHGVGIAAGIKRQSAAEAKRARRRIDPKPFFELPVLAISGLSAEINGQDAARRTAS
jgi:hypothetical protein